jgi:hypothetical protein
MWTSVFGLQPNPTLRNTCVQVFINDAVPEFKMEHDYSLYILAFPCYCHLMQ